MQPVLELCNLSRHFGAIEALSDISLSVEKGDVVGLVGDNGAGKSTAIKIIAGNFPPTSGTVRVDGNDTILSSPSDARDAGIEVVYQDLALCNHLSASSNLFLGRELTKGVGFLRLLDRRRMRASATEFLSRLRSDTRPQQLVGTMSGGQRQAVAIARTLLSHPKVVLMDEPTAAISVRQVAEVLDLIKNLQNQGIAVVIVSHRMPDIFAVSNRIVVLRRGRKVADKRTVDTSPDEITGLITGAIESA